MTQISSRKWTCDDCGKRMLKSDVVFIDTRPQISLCLSCAKEFMKNFEIWKANKQAENEIVTDEELDELLKEYNESEGKKTKTGVWSKDWDEHIGMFVIHHRKGFPKHPKEADYLLR